MGANSPAVLGQATLWHRADAGLAESPRWDTRHARLYWVDLAAESIHWLDRDGPRRLDVGVRVSALARGPGKSWLAVAQTGVLRFLPDTQAVGEVAPIRLRPGEVVNDAAVDREGRLWVGTAHSDGGARLLRLGGAESQLTALDGLQMSNGLAFVAGSGDLWHVDSKTKLLRRFPMATDNQGLADSVLELAITHGTPDGLALSADGDLWLALWGAGEVARFSGTGDLKGVVKVPTPNVSSCEFAGNALLITTAAADDPSDAAGGQIYMYQADVVGQPRFPARI